MSFVIESMFDFAFRRLVVFCGLGVFAAFLLSVLYRVALRLDAWGPLLRHSLAEIVYNVVLDFIIFGVVQIRVRRDTVLLLEGLVLRCVQTINVCTCKSH